MMQSKNAAYLERHNKERTHIHPVFNMREFLSLSFSGSEQIFCIDFGFVVLFIIIIKNDSYEKFHKKIKLCIIGFIF